MSKRRRLVADINIVPYIDVMLVLLMVFMITAPLLSQGVKVDLPEAKAKSLEAPNDPPLIVTVDKRGQYYLNVNAKPDESLDAEHLTQLIQLKLRAATEKHQKQAVYVRGDKEANYGEVMQAMVLLQQVGVEKIGLITEPKA